jgi:F-box interacting protein
MPTKSNKRMKTSSIGPAAALPDEMVTEVLLRLPVKSLLRFRSVCRSWAATISSDEFCALHMARGGAPTKLLVVAPTAAYDATALYSCSTQGSSADLLFTLDDLRGDFVDGMAAQCRGLTLLYDAAAPAYYVVNAATRASTRLPPCPDVWYSSAGLGFDTQAKEYKVMRLFKKSGAEVMCEVYTLGGEHGDRWRPAAGRIPSAFSETTTFALQTAAHDNIPPVFANGSLHWLIDHKFWSVAGVADPAAAIIKFSVTDETFGFIQSLPFGALGAHLANLDGCLCAVRDLRHGSPDHSRSMEIWKLKDAWSLDTRIVFSQHTPMGLLEPNVLSVLGAIADDCRSARKIIIATSNHTVYAYDVRSSKVEAIPSIAETDANYKNKRAAVRICLFKESLAPVHRTHQEISFSSPLVKAAKEILLRLPARSVAYSNLVCKQWRRLVESKSFAHSYFAHKRMENTVKIMLVGKGTGRFRKGTGPRLFFRFSPLQNNPLTVVGNRDAWLDTKVVCSKPCHGLNLLSTSDKDYLYNPCTGYSKARSNPGTLARVPWEAPSRDVWRIPDNAFVIGNKNIGLGFNRVGQEHVAVVILYYHKDFKSRDYHLTCSVWHCRRGYLHEGFVPPLPVNDMPPAYVAGAFYWMSDPRLGPCNEHAIVSFDIAEGAFDLIRCPQHIAEWNKRRARRVFVVELQGELCVVVADVAADEFVVWRVEHGDQWDRAYTVRLRASPGYSLVSDIVLPLAVDPKDGRILLSTGRRVVFYDLGTETVEELYAADEMLRSDDTARTGVIPMLYEESLVMYPRVISDRCMR